MEVSTRREELWLPRGLALLNILRHRGIMIAGGLLIPLLPQTFPAGAEEPVASAPRVEEIAPPLTLPVEINDQVENWMGRYLTDLRPIFEWYLQREGLYADMIREALRRRGMPEDLLYLAAIESGFSPGAISKESAMGMWQFMGPTARALGLRMDAYVDERRDPILATEAALEYLQYLHERFGSWYLAAAAYNAGPSRLADILSLYTGEQTGGEDLYWKILDDLPLETRVYVPKILAATLLAQEAEKYGFRVEQADPVFFERVWVPGGTPLSVVAEAVGTSLGPIRDLNPQLVQGMTPPGELYGVRVPVGQSPLVVASLGSRWRTISLAN